MSAFHVVPGAFTAQVLAGSRPTVMALVAEAYRTHEAGRTINPDSYFLTFPEKPDSRVIALPAYLGGDVDTIGIKWIASFPGNVRHGRPRASAVLLLNDYATGYPIACMEAAGISAARTAASAAVAARALTPAGHRRASTAIVGAGVIARTVFDYLTDSGAVLGDLVVHDQDPASADHLVRHASERLGYRATRADSLDEALKADLVVFATTAAEPYVPADTQFRPGQLILNISLRDLAPELLLTANNIVDDIDHCLKARTSPHLAELLTGGRDFINGTLGGLLAGDVALDPGRPTVFSPFGLGVLDIAVGRHVLGEAIADGAALDVPGFFGETQRW
ncbi:2,3-diaminopropionate biosynthesis protein SbnB [Streptomyces sp. NPDC048111]|uniref:2,3-diaminopropionate biosynthesis protein SbnB n=1 Tax=Streptomyces sp. NPDC048111 TaxID=3365500 RepID=UPI00370FCB16